MAKQCCSDSKAATTVRRLNSASDEAVPRLSQPRLMLKIDTQGFDLKVIQGLGQRMSTIVALQLELSFVPLYEGIPTLAESIGTLKDLGFQIVDFFPAARDSKDICAIECDCLMVHPGSLASRRP